MKACPWKNCVLFAETEACGQEGKSCSHHLALLCLLYPLIQQWLWSLLSKLYLLLFYFCRVLTVPGTLLQDRNLLCFYKKLWNCVALEMEGSYYAREVGANTILCNNVLWYF